MCVCSAATNHRHLKVNECQGEGGGKIIGRRGVKGRREGLTNYSSEMKTVENTAVLENVRIAVQEG